MSLGRRKMVRPFPNRGMSLWNGCLFAVACGWNKGWDDLTGATTEDDQTRKRGVLQGSRAGTHVINDTGWSLASGVSDDPIEWGGLAGRWAIPATAGMSAAIACRPRALPTVSDQTVFSKRGGVALADGGWSIQMDFNGGSPRWKVEVSSGGAEASALSTTGPSTARTDMVVLTFDRQNLYIYVNGRLEATSAAVMSVSNATLNINLFNTEVTDTQSDAEASMCALWSRRLSEQEVATLYTDPFRMWRPLHREFMFGPAALGAFQTFFLNFG